MQRGEAVPGSGPGSDNGPEFVSKVLLSWIVAQGIDTALIEPGKPWQNGVAESFNGKLRDECLSLEWFRTRAEAKPIIERWRRHYNEVRPHSSLGYLTPNEFAAQRANAASRHATGRVAAVPGPPRPGPLHKSAPKGEHGATKGRRLKLTVVRKNWAGHTVDIRGKVKARFCVPWFGGIAHMPGIREAAILFQCRNKEGPSGC